MSTQRHKTSVFSEYENNSNSVSSKQLEYWLMQMAPTSHTSPKFGQDWNLVSTSSRYEDGITFGGRQDTFSSANKQNILGNNNFSSNLSLMQQQMTKPHLQTQPHQTQPKSKSYINAMQQLQKRAKTLEQQNLSMRKSIQLLQQQKRSSMQSSMVESQMMKQSKLRLEQSQKRIENMVKENKKLRDGKNQQQMKMRLMEKALTQQRQKMGVFEKRLDELSCENQSLKKDLVESSNIAKALLVENKQLCSKVQTLENMKEKSTTSILEKYAKSLERLEELEMQLSQAKNKCSSVEEKSRKMIEQKDAKAMKMMEETSAVRLEKEQLALRYGVLKDENQQKSQRIRNLEEKLKQMEGEMTEKQRLRKEVQKLLTKKNQQHEKLAKNYIKLQTKYSKLSVKHNQMLNQLQSSQQNNLSNPQSPQPTYHSPLQSSPQHPSNFIMEQEQHNLPSTPQQQQQSPINEDNLRRTYEGSFEEQQQSQSSCHYEKDDFQDEEEFAESARPLSIIVKAKNSQARIKSDGENQDEGEQGLESSTIVTMRPSNARSTEKQAKQTKTTTKNQRKTSMKPIVNDYAKKNPTQSIRNNSLIKKTPSNSKSRKDSIKSNQSNQSKQPLKQSLKQSTYFITKPSKNPASQTNRSKSSSVNKSLEHKRKSISNSKSIKSHNNTKTNRKVIISSSSKGSQSRYIKQNELDHTNMQNNIYSNNLPQSYTSAQPNRYPIIQDIYYYTNQINKYPMTTSTNCYDQHLSSYPNASFPNNTSMLSSTFAPSAKTIDKAMLLQYQEQALKLYEEHEKLIELSEDQSIGMEKKAELMGRMQQVIKMIDHNTEKIMAIKCRENIV